MCTIEKCQGYRKVKYTRVYYILHDIFLKRFFIWTVYYIYIRYNYKYR